jgi:hypothetical protein
LNSIFNDSNLAIHYIQQFLNETYNPNIYITGKYYQTFDMNYGFAHYIAKYLDRTFPVLDESTKQEYQNVDQTNTRDIKQPISLLNYFLSDNKSNILHYSDPVTQTISNDQIYNKIYNNFMMVHYDSETGTYKPWYNGKYMVKNDLPLFTKLTNDQYSVNDQTIFKLSSWPKEKSICELDDLVMSYLLGRTITPNSSMEEIYYVQKLLINDRDLYREEKGNWYFKRPDGTTLTDTIMDFQKQCSNNYGDTPILVTGYFDIFTEQRAKMKMIPGGGLSVHGL